MARALLVSLALIAVAFSGCLGDDEAVEPTNTTPVTAPAPALAQEGNLVGTVVGDTQNPVPGATVGLLRNASFNTTVAQDGTYTLSDVPAGEHLIHADADGFIGQTFSVRIKSAQTTVLDITLQPEPIDTPYHESQEFGGLLDCAFVVASADTPHRLPCVQIDPNARSILSIDIQPEPVRVLIEITWEASQPLAESLYASAKSSGLGHQNQVLGDREGENVLRLDIPEPVLERFYGDGGEMEVNVTAAPSLGDEEGVAIGAAIEQEFTMVVTQFFIDPGAEDFSAVSG